MHALTSKQHAVDSIFAHTSFAQAQSCNFNRTVCCQRPAPPAAAARSALNSAKKLRLRMTFRCGDVQARPHAIDISYEIAGRCPAVKTPIAYPRLHPAAGNPKSTFFSTRTPCARRRAAPPLPTCWFRGFTARPPTLAVGAYHGADKQAACRPDRAASRRPGANLHPKRHNRHARSSST